METEYLVMLYGLEMNKMKLIYWLIYPQSSILASFEKKEKLKKSGRGFLKKLECHNFAMFTMKSSGTEMVQLLTLKMGFLCNFSRIKKV